MNLTTKPMKEMNNSSKETPEEKKLRKMLAQRHELEEKIAEAMQKQHKTLTERIELLQKKIDRKKP